MTHIIRQRKKETIGSTRQIDSLITLRQLTGGRHLLRYLSRTLTEGGGRHASHLIDEMISDGHDYMAQGEQAGMIKSSAVPHDR